MSRKIEPVYVLANAVVLCLRIIAVADNYLEFWYAALRSSSGFRVRISSGDKATAKAKLYKARSEALDERLTSLSITDSPTADNELWIVHSKKDESNGS